MSRSCQSATSSSAGITAPLDDAREAAEVLAQDRVSLVRHRARPFLADRERLLRFAHFAALPVAHVRREPLDRRRGERERGRSTRRGDRARRPACSLSPAESPSLPERALLDLRREVRVRPDRPGDLADRDLRARDLDPLLRPRHLGVVPGEREAERDRLGEDAVAPADHRRRARARGPASRARRAACRRARGARSAASRSWIASDVSSTSLDVIPRWSQRASMPAFSSTCVRNAITSCFVVRSISSMRVASSWIFFARIAAAVPARDELRLFHRVARGELDFEPGAVAVVGGPERSELVRRVARDHRLACTDRTSDVCQARSLADREPRAAIIRAEGGPRRRTVKNRRSAVRRGESSRMATKIYVGNLPYTCDEQQLRDLFGSRRAQRRPTWPSSPTG